MKIVRNTARNFSEEVQQTPEGMMTIEEAIQALTAKYNALPTMEAKKTMAQDMVDNGLPEEVVAQVTQGNFSEEPVAEPVAVVTEETVQAIGPENTAVEGCVTETPVNPVDGTLPGDTVIATQADIMTPSPEQIDIFDAIIGGPSIDPVEAVIADPADMSGFDFYF